MIAMNADSTSTKWANPDWDFYKRHDAIRLWKAVLLTLDVDPTKMSQAIYRKDGKNAKDHTLWRIDVRNALAETKADDKVLWVKKHPHNGPSSLNYMVDLSSLVAFAETRGRTIPPAMIEHWGTPKSEAINKSAETKKADSLEKIIAALVHHIAMGNPSHNFNAVVTVIQRWMTSPEFMVSPETLKNHVDGIIQKYFKKETELIKRLARTRYNVTP